MNGIYSSANNNCRVRMTQGHLNYLGNFYSVEDKTTNFGCKTNIQYWFTIESTNILCKYFEHFLECTPSVRGFYPV